MPRRSRSRCCSQGRRASTRPARTTRPAAAAVSRILPTRRRRRRRRSRSATRSAGSPAEVTNLPTTLLWGDDAIEEELGGLRFRVRPNAFLQTNTAMAERLYELAAEYAALTGGETVYDLYCGIGTIGVVLARNALTVWGVEVSHEAVACAIENAELNGVANAAFFAGDVARSLEELRDRAGEADVVVVDPPRAGLSGKTVRWLARLTPARLVYVS